jgi:hypothetical protein
MSDRELIRLHHLRAYIEALGADDLLGPEGATCELFARVDDDRKRLALADLDMMFAGLGSQAASVRDAAADSDLELAALERQIRRIRHLLTRR